MTRVLAPLLLTLLAVPACATLPVSGTDPGPSVETSAAPLATVPVAASAALVPADELDCDAEPALGGRADDFGPPGGGSSPERALEVFVQSGLFHLLPQAGYERIAENGDEVLFAYRVGGRTKVAVAVTLDGPTGGTWQVESFAACEIAELGPQASLGPGITVWAHDDGSILTDHRGAAHCDWESATFIRIDDRQYVRDPQGVLGTFGFLSTYSADAELPGDAAPTGYRHGDREIWSIPDDTAIYVVSPDAAERWPGAAETIACR